MGMICSYCQEWSETIYRTGYSTQQYCPICGVDLEKYTPDWVGEDAVEKEMD